MPKYAYACTKCSHYFEVSHSYKERREDCPQCAAKKTLQKVLDTPINKVSGVSGRRLQSAHRVHDAISQGKREVDEEKKRLQKRENKK